MTKWQQKMWFLSPHNTNGKERIKSHTDVLKRKQYYWKDAGEISDEGIGEWWLCWADIRVISTVIPQNMYTVMLCFVLLFVLPSQWHHNKCDGVSNHLRLKCLLNRFFRRKQKINDLRQLPLSGEFTVDQCIPRTKGQWRGKYSIWWCLHDITTS